MEKSKKPAVSIITPVHNAELYIADCIDSILDQDYQDWELILTDDGSTDKTTEICLQYVRKDNRIRLLRQETCKGVSAARNRGLKEARGEFVIFVDADDLLPEDSISLRINSIENADLLCANIDEIDEKGEYIKPGLTKCADSILNNQDAVRIITVNGEQGYQGYCYNKLLRMDIIEKNHIRFNEGISYNEDRLFCFHYVRCCQKVRMINKTVYHYRQVPESALHKLNSLSDEDAPKAMSEFTAFDIILGLTKKDYSETYYLLCTEAQKRAIDLNNLYGPHALLLRSETRKKIRKYGIIALRAPGDIIPMKQKMKIIYHSVKKR